jgi:hypothetical protein
VTAAKFQAARFLAHPDAVPVLFGSPEDDRPKAVGWYDPASGALRAALEFRIAPEPKPRPSDMTLLTRSDRNSGDLVYLKHSVAPARGEHALVSSDARIPFRPLVTGLSTLGVAEGPRKGDAAKATSLEAPDGSRTPIRSVDASAAQDAKVDVTSTPGKPGIQAATVTFANRGSNPCLVKASSADPQAYFLPSSRSVSFSVPAGGAQTLQMQSPRPGSVPVSYSAAAYDPKTGLVGGSPQVGGALTAAGPSGAAPLLAMSGRADALPSLNGVAAPGSPVAGGSDGNGRDPWRLASIPAAAGLVAFGANAFSADGSPSADSSFTLVPSEVRPDLVPYRETESGTFTPVLQEDRTLGGYSLTSWTPSGGTPILCLRPTLPGGAFLLLSDPVCLLTDNLPWVGGLSSTLKTIKEVGECCATDKWVKKGADGKPMSYEHTEWQSVQKAWAAEKKVQKRKCRVDRLEKWHCSYVKFHGGKHDTTLDGEEETHTPLEEWQTCHTYRFIEGRWVRVGGYGAEDKDPAHGPCGDLGHKKNTK